MQRRDFLKLAGLGIGAMFLPVAMAKTYSTKGLRDYIENNNDTALDWSAGLTEKQFDQFLIEGPARYGTQPRVMILPKEAAELLNRRI